MKLVPRVRGKMRRYGPHFSVRGRNRVGVRVKLGGRMRQPVTR